MAIAVTIETTIARPPAEVFARDRRHRCVAVVAHRQRHRPRRAASTTARWSTGERLDVEQRAAGRAGTFAGEVTALQPPTGLALHGRDGDGVIDRHRCRRSRPRVTARACAGRSGSGCRCATGCSSRWRGRRSSAPPRSMSRRCSAAWSRRRGLTSVHAGSRRSVDAAAPRRRGHPLVNDLESPGARPTMTAPDRTYDPSASTAARAGSPPSSRC